MAIHKNKKTRASNNGENKKSISWPARILRAIMIGFGIYVFLVLLSAYFAHKGRAAIEEFNNRRAQQDEEPFVAWNGKAPTTKSELQHKVGYEWADVNQVRKHALCRERWAGNHKLYENGGCSQYVTKVNVTDVIKKMPPRKNMKEWRDGGGTTAECAADRQARWDLILNDMVERGDGYAASVDSRRVAGPDIEECNNLDNARIYEVIHMPQLRLTEILRRVRNGGVFTDEDRLTIQKDYPGVESFPSGHSNYRERYLSEVDELFKIAGGKEYVLGKAKEAGIPDLETLNKSAVPCEDYLAKIESFKAKDAEIAANEAKVEQSSREWQDLNQARVANMNAWGMLAGDAKASGCVSE